MRKLSIYGKPVWSTRLFVLPLILICAFILAFSCSNIKGGKTKVQQIDDLYQKYKKDFPNVPEITVDELIKVQKNNKVVLVDERDKKEQNVSMIPGAIRSDEFNINNFAGYTLVVYCTIGSRSGHYIKDLPQKDIKAYNLKGGVLSWAHAGNIFIDDQGNETKRVHVYGPTWDLLPEGYESVW